MAGFATYGISVDRDAGIFTLQIDYGIEAYVDPETGESFGDTSWTASYGPVGNPPNGGQSGYGSEFDSAYVTIGLDPGEALQNNHFAFNALNTFSGATTGFDLNVLVAAYATAPLSVAGTLGSDLAITGSGNDLIRTLDDNDVIDAGAGDDIVDAGTGNDVIDGGAGIDVMIGGEGDDTYVVDSPDDAVVERSGGGYDTVLASVSFTLAAQVEQLVLVGAGPLEGTGNSQDNRLEGNGDVNVLRGLEGNDILVGNGGNDILEGGIGRDVLDGGTGDDRMTGGAGNDTYEVDSRGDRVIESAGGGVDTVWAIEMPSYTLAAEVENLLLLSSTGGRGTGNGLANTITGTKFADVLDGAGGDDRLDGGEGNDTLIGDAGADRLLGGAGTDRASYLGATAAVTVNLTTGKGSGGDAQGDTYSSIENVLGGSGNDHLTGNRYANVLDGGLGDDTIDGAGGNDVITGGGGADRLSGGAGLDTLSYAGSIGGVTVDLGSLTAAGGDAAGDVFDGFESLTGGLGNDGLTGNGLANAIFGGAGVDTIDGGGGNDVIEGGGGADVLAGGAGIDRLSYARAAGGVTVDLATGTGSGSDAAGDTFGGFENLGGGGFGDHLTGDGFANTLIGAGGDDWLDGAGGNDMILGGAGGDTMFGGAGIDTLSYSTATSWVSVSLAEGTGFGNDAAADQFSGFENLTGGSFGDALYGDGQANTINGGAGGDFINGAGGNDLLTGGAGDDTFVFTPGFGRDTIRDFHAGEGSEDTLYFSMGPDYGSASAVMSVASSSGANTVFTFDANTRLTLLGVDMNKLVAGDFLFD